MGSSRTSWEGGKPQQRREDPRPQWWKVLEGVEEGTQADWGWVQGKPGGGPALILEHWGRDLLFLNFDFSVSKMSTTETAASTVQCDGPAQNVTSWGHPHSSFFSYSCS